MITAIDAAFDISAATKTKEERIDMLLDYISDVTRQKALSKSESLISFYDSEINAAKNKLKEISVA